MADIRIKDLATTATTTASDDFMAVDGATNGTRKLSAATPAFLTSVTTPSLTAPASNNLTLAGGTAGSDSVVVSNTLAASSAIIGAFKVGNNTAATNVAIGGGNINAGGSITSGSKITIAGNAASDALRITESSTNSGQAGLYITRSGAPAGTAYGSYVEATGAATANVAGYFTATGATANRAIEIGSGVFKSSDSTASTGVGTGALQVAGGIYAGAASYFAGAVTVNAGVKAIGFSADPGVGNINISNATYPTSGWAFRIPDNGAIINLSLDGAIGGTWQQVLGFDRSNAAATFAGAVSVSGTAATWTSGTGSPESVKTAPVGSLYTRTNGGASTTLYVKESGAGNTGWIAK